MFFFDTYALIEIIRGSEKYKDYKVTDMVTTSLNLMEVYYWLLNNFDREKADFFYEETRDFCAEIGDEIIKEAALLRKENKRRNLSYIDCLGYVVAFKMRVKFLTGDIQFRDMDNVEFVK